MKPAIKRNLLFILLLISANCFADPAAEAPVDTASLGGAYFNPDIFMDEFTRDRSLGGYSVPPGFGDTGSTGAFGSAFSSGGAFGSTELPPVDYLGVGPIKFSRPGAFGSYTFDDYRLYTPRIQQNNNIDWLAQWQRRDTGALIIDTSRPAELYSCGLDDNENAMEELNQASAWSSCFDLRSSHVAEPNASNGELLTKDMDACSCLRNSPVDAVKTLMNQNQMQSRTAASDENFSERLRDQMNAHWAQPQNAKELNGEFSDTLNSIAFQANVVSRGRDPDFVGAMTPSYFGDNPATAVFASSDDGYTLNPRVDREATLPLLRDEDYPENQCLSPIDFLAMKQIPAGEEGNLVKEDMGKEPFNKDEWDYTFLQQEYDAIMAKPIRERTADRDTILKLKAKLAFLDRNPMVKFILGAAASDVGLLVDKMSPEHAAEVRNIYNSADYDALKNRMYRIMSQLGRPNCQRQCIRGFQSALKGFFEDHPDRMKLVTLEAHKDSLRRMKEKVNSTNYMAQNAVEPTQQNIITQFIQNYNLPSPDTCRSGPTMSTDQAINCLEIYAGYCRTVDSYAPQIQDLSKTDPSLLDNLDQLTADDLNTNIETNEEFARLNQEVCHEQRPSRRLFGRRRNYFEFRDELCQRENPPQCRNKNSPESVRFFRDEFDEDRPLRGRDAGDRTYAQMNETEAGAQMSEADAQSISAGIGSGTGPRNPFRAAETYAENRRSERERLALQDGSPTRSEEEVTTAAMSATSLSNNNQTRRTQDPVEESSFDYSAAMAGAIAGPSRAGTETATTEPQRVQDMDQTRRQEMLDDWEKEYGIWKERYGSDKSPATAAQDTQYREEISTLRALLDQQRQISDQQFQLLNDAIAARTRAEQEAIAQNEDRLRERRERSDESSGFSEGTSIAASTEEGVTRGPASIADPQFASSGASGGGSASSGGASVGGGAGGGSAAVSGNGNADSVAREQAKLDNIRTFSDGSIIISSPNPSATPNAITVTVSGEELNLIRTNPDRIISQVQRDVTPEQLAELQQNGEVTVLVRTQNPNDPVYRMRLSKVNERLVVSYDSGTSGAPPAPMQRVYLRSSLENLTRELASPAN